MFGAGCGRVPIEGVSRNFAGKLMIDVAVVRLILPDNLDDIVSVLSGPASDGRSSQSAMIPKHQAQ